LSHIGKLANQIAVSVGWWSGCGAVGNVPDEARV
jgi:hypothetical protein